MQLQNFLPKTHIYLLLGVILTATVLFIVIPETPDTSKQAPEAKDQPTATTTIDFTAPDDFFRTLPHYPPYDYRVKKGDTLSDIFAKRGISGATLYKILSADTEYLSLETLHPGTKLTFTYDDTHAFTSLILHLDPARTITFSKQSNGDFTYTKTEAPTHWQTQPVLGDIHGSFYHSGIKAGLDKGQLAELTHLLKNKINFRRDLRDGDSFVVLVGHEKTAKTTTGNTRIEAVSLRRGKQTYNAFLYKNGNYYDENGQSLTLAFLRWPTKRHYRVSSPFNPHRLHPITGRKAPHNGVDLAMPTGTPVMSTGDGVVKRIGNHPYAGKYIDIDHSGSFSTRYLHLSKIYVKRGQRVKRGQTIALSGNTGRTTGPHLHFEFHIKGRPVNPLTAKIPTSAQVPSSELAAFKAQVKWQLARMHFAKGFTSPLLEASEDKRL